MSFSDSRIHEHIKEETVELGNRIDSLARNIERSLGYLHGIPSLLAQEETILKALSHSGASVLSPPLVLGQLEKARRKKFWSEDVVLSAASRYLGAASAALGADVLWIMNATGDCIAASNVNQPDSFVGANFAHRQYFQMAQEGKPGKQYAMGSVSHIAGLYFSAPIMLDGRFVGAAVAKINLPSLSHWVNQADAFISDEHGVIILARDPALEMHALPHAAISGLTRAERQARYNRMDFPTLAIDPLESGYHPALRRFGHDGQPLLMSSRRLKDDAIEIHAVMPLPRIAQFNRERDELFLSLAAIGTLLLLAAAGSIAYVRMRNRTQSRLAETASQLRAIVESTADGILVIDNERHVVVCNQRFAEMWRIPAEVLASGQDRILLDFVADQLENPQCFMEKVAELYAQPEANSFDAIKFRDGRIFERHSLPQRLDGHVIGRVWSFRDVTERERLEDNLKQMNEKLEQRVAEAVARNREKDHMLIQQSRLASMGEMIGNIAHQWRQPINALALLLANLKDAWDYHELDEATLDKSVADGQRMIQKMSATIDDFRNFFKPDKKKQTFLACTGIEEAIKLVHPSFKNNNIEIEFEVCGKRCNVTGYPNEFSQVMLNTLINAKDAILARKVRGKVHIHTEHGGDALIISISDNGGGIPEEILGKVFDPYFTTKGAKGTGIGLYMSKMIMDNMGGNISIRNSGDGAEVLISMPLAKNPPE